MTERPELMIGDFARRSRLPVSTLRYYDRIGLLAPALVDPSSGYRRYAPEQLPAAMLISRLRSLGTPPDRIARILAGGSSASAVLLEERHRIEAQIATARRRLRQLDELLAHDTRHDFDVEVVTLEGREVAALPYLLPATELQTGVTRTIGRLRSALRRGRQRRTGAWGATFPVDLPEEASGFVFAPVDSLWHGDLDTAWLPAGRAVTTVHSGSLATLPLAYRAVFDRLDRLGASAGGPVVEEYLGLDDSAEWVAVVRIAVPIDETTRGTETLSPDPSVPRSRR